MRSISLGLPVGSLAERKHWPSIRVVLVPGALSIFVLWLGRALLFQPGQPWGVDTYLHLTRVAYMAKQLRETGSLPQWFPFWYNGTPLEQYYPPLAGYLMLPIQLVTNDVALTYRVFVVGCLLLAALVSWRVLQRWTTPAWAALGAAMYVATPYTYIYVFQDGNASRTVILILMPLLLQFTVSLLSKGNWTSFLGVTATTFLLILTHHQQGAMILIELGVICLVYLGRDTASRYRVVMALAAMCLGIGLTAWWLLPGLTHFDYATVPDVTLLPERQWIYSISWDVFNPATGPASRVAPFYLGLALAAGSTASVLLRPTRLKIACYASAITSVWLAFGVYNPIYRFLPLANSFFPERFLTLAVLLFAFLVSDLGRTALKRRVKRWRRLVMFALIALLTIWDFSTWWSVSRMTSFGQITNALDHLPVRQDLSRFAARASGMNSEWSYLPLADFKQPLAYGWSVETTPHSPTFAQINLAVRNGFLPFVLRNFAMWNVRSTIVTGDEPALVNALKQAGFLEMGRLAGDTILADPAPSTPVMKLRSNGIAIGRGAYPSAMVIPWLTFGSSPNVDDYDPRYLDHFNLIYLYDFQYNDPQKLELKIRSWLSQGKTVLVDLTGVPDAYLFGVETKIIEVPRKPEFTVGPDADFYVDGVASEPFEFEGGGWRGISYYDMDSTLVNVKDIYGGTWPVIGFKTVPEGRVYFVGMNWITHIQQSHDPLTAEFMDRFFQRANPNREVMPEAFLVESIQSPADNWGFDYQSDSDDAVVVSETWSSHWQATVDGQPTTIYNHENLIALELPAGEHRVDLHYVGTPVQVVGWAISLAFVGLLIVTYRWYARFPGWFRWVEERVREMVWE